MKLEKITFIHLLYLKKLKNKPPTNELTRNGVTVEDSLDWQQFEHFQHKVKSTVKGEYRDSEYRKIIDKFLNKHQKGGLFEWIK